MWTDHTKTAKQIKFRNVPFKYTMKEIEHVDHVGMFWRFNNGEQWLTLNDKRLFLIPDGRDEHIAPGPESAEDWPIMEPDELKEFLARPETTPFEVLDAQWQGIKKKIIARLEQKRDIAPDDRQTCGLVRCYTSGECYPESGDIGNCFRCARRSCSWTQTAINAIIGGGGSPHRFEIKREDEEARTVTEDESAGHGKSK